MCSTNLWTARFGSAESLAKWDIRMCRKSSRDFSLHDTQYLSWLGKTFDTLRGNMQACYRAAASCLDGQCDIHSQAKVARLQGLA